ncbi:MAG: carboxypeptidase-like regulatory domain-containing protein [Verrucomicrobiota bacterium]
MMWKRGTVAAPAGVAGGVVLAGMLGFMAARPSRVGAAGAQTVAAHVAIDADDIGGVVTGPGGPEAGVWVIAETSDLPTRYRKIVVTDDRGRYVVPDLPKANYEVWVRGYGLVDSAHVQARPGQELGLTAVRAPSAKAAAQYYPANYWYALMQIPPKSAFPISVPNLGRVGNGESEAVAVDPSKPKVVQNQAEWIGMLKCNACHQMGNLATRELSKPFAAAGSSSQAWDRAMRAGQTGKQMMASADKFGHERALAMFADWSDRIAAGELPQAPPRPQGVERNVVITLWDFSLPTAFVHDVLGTDRRHPTTNAYGPIYGSEWSHDSIVVVDPVKHTKGMTTVPLKNESDRPAMTTWSPQSQDVPSPVWGDKLIWNDPVNPHSMAMDSGGRLWFNANTQASNHQAAYCKEGSSNPYAKNLPIPRNGRGLDYFDPKTGTITTFNLCFNTSHLAMGEDADDTIYFTTRGALGGIGWAKTKVLLATGDEEKAQGWCPSILDYNGDGKLGAYTRAPEPPDAALDRLIPSGGYGIAVSAVDRSVWYVSPISQTGMPGRILRMHPGANPPATCTTEVYEPPYNNPKMPGVTAAGPRGIDVDGNGVVWTALSDTTQLASFDRRKCKGALNGPTATGQHCPEGWTLYNAPGPRFKGAADPLGADYLYYNWVDQFDTFGLGRNTPLVNGTWSDSIMALQPGTGTWITMRVPYPLGFYSRNLSGRIDDPNAGWKGRGLWTNNGTRTTWHNEGGKTATSELEKAQTSYVAHFQLRPDPLAK